MTDILDNPDEAMAFLLDIPSCLTRLEARISEGLPTAEAKAFRSTFIQAANVRADFSNVWPRFAVWLFLDSKHGVIQYAIPINKKYMQAIARTYQRVLEGEPLDASEWLKDAHKGTEAQIANAAYNYAALHVSERVRHQEDHHRRQAKKLLSLLNEARYLTAPAQSLGIEQTNDRITRPNVL